MTTFTLYRRNETPRSTWGELLGNGAAIMCKVLERGALNRDHPRIPSGTYELARKPFGSSHFDRASRDLMGEVYKGILWLPRVPGRTNIEIHTANHFTELLGCLALGDEITADDNGDFMITGGTSKPAYARIYPILSEAIDEGGAQLTIKDFT